MSSPAKVDPYNGFKNDVERRKALGTLVRWRAFSLVGSSLALAAAGHTEQVRAVLRLLLSAGI